MKYAKRNLKKEKLFLTFLRVKIKIISFNFMKTLLMALYFSKDTAYVAPSSIFFSFSLKKGQRKSKSRALSLFFSLKKACLLV